MNRSRSDSWRRFVALGTELWQLARLGYDAPYDALREKTQSSLTLIVSTLDYSSLMMHQADEQAWVEESGSNVNNTGASNTGQMPCK
jgi:hypothetical protein